MWWLQLPHLPAHCYTYFYHNACHGYKVQLPSYKLPLVISTINLTALEGRTENYIKYTCQDLDSSGFQKC